MVFIEHSGIISPFIRTARYMSNEKSFGEYEQIRLHIIMCTHTTDIICS